MLGNACLSVLHVVLLVGELHQEYAVATAAVELQASDGHEVVDLVGESAWASDDLQYVLTTRAVWLDVASNQAFLQGLDVCGENASALSTSRSMKINVLVKASWVGVAVSEQLKIVVSLAGLEFVDLVRKFLNFFSAFLSLEH